ncbi:hypothetical protein LguiB_028206 [Lonicera macranthoides]
MEFSEEWKALWPISSVFSPPLLLNSEEIGPIIFNPSPKTLTKLFTCPSLAPPLPPQFTNLSLTRFLRTCSPYDSSVLVSTSSLIASTFGPQFSISQLPQNSLQLLRCPGTNLVIAFFPTGSNSNQIGFLLLSMRNSTLAAHGYGGEVFTAKHEVKHRIVRLLVNPISDSSSSSDNSCCTTVGYLLAWTLYSCHWFRVKISGVGSDSGLERPELDFIGSKLFKSSAIIHACWSPHLPEESVVLLESGELFLFDLDSCSVSSRFKGRKMKVMWDHSNISETGRWVGCDFSWHPRILIVAHSSAVFLVDLRSEGCKLSCLLKIETLTSVSSANDDRFVSLTRAGSDGFYFTVASNRLLLLCDVRKAMMPLLQWAHGLDSPLYITVFRLSELRSHTKDDQFNWASESGYGILLGSFWNCEFSLFCYGPDTRGTVASEVSRFCKSLYAWGLPSELSLMGCDCQCGSCLVREELSKDSLPQWIDWRQKKEIVLGFGILDKDLSADLSEPDIFGGFTLIRLTSSGKLESQRYCALWDFQKNSKEAHKESSLNFEESHLYTMGDVEYKLDKRFRYLKLDCLKGYLNDNLGDVLVRKLKKSYEGPDEKHSFRSDFHQNICQKLKACGVRRLRESFVVDDLLTDISVPMSIHEIAVRSIWASLPMDLLRLAFSTYSEFLEVLVNHMKVSLEFLDIPDRPHLPPFSFRKPSLRSSKWSQKMQPSDAFVGPVVPLQFLVSLRNLQNEEAGEISPHSELKLQCNKVMQVAKEVVKPDSGFEIPNDHVVSLADDREDISHCSKKECSFSLHKPLALLSYNSSISEPVPTPENSFAENEMHTTCIYKTRMVEFTSNAEKEMVGLELFDTQCPSELKFDDRPLVFGPKELKIYKLLKRQQSNFEKGFGLYQDYLNRPNV